MEIPIEEIVFLVNGVEHYLYGHVFEETEEAIQLASRFAIFNGEPGKTGGWYQKDTIKNRRVISTVDSKPTIDEAPENRSHDINVAITQFDIDLSALRFAGWKVAISNFSNLHAKFNYCCTMQIEDIKFFIEKQNLAEIYDHMMAVGRAWESADPKPVFKHEGEKEVWLRKLLI